MKRTTIFADERLLDELKAISREEDRSVAEIIREAVVEYVKLKRSGKKKLSIVGLGASGRGDISERHEELLWQKKRR